MMGPHIVRPLLSWDTMKKIEIERIFQGYQPQAVLSDRGAAVLLPLLERAGDTHVLFEVRAVTLRHQPGEICFPGGRMEPGETVTDCVLRETEEELGLSRDEIQIIAPLEAVRHSSGKLIEPILGWVESMRGMRIQPSEVEEIFTVPLSWFQANPPKWASYALVPDMEHAPEELKQFLPNYRRERKTPIWVYEGHVIWGMTARVLVNFLEKISAEF